MLVIEPRADGAVSLLNTYPGFSSQLKTCVRSAPVLELHLAHESRKFGPSGKMICDPLRSASMLGPCASAGKVNVSEFPNMTGYE